MHVDPKNNGAFPVFVAFIRMFDQYGKLSNRFHSNTEFDGEIYPTAHHFVEACKILHLPKFQELIRSQLFDSRMDSMIANSDFSEREY